MRADSDPTRQGGPQDRRVRSLIVVAWAYSVIPSMLQISQHGRSYLDVTEDATLTGFSSVSSRLLFVCLLALGVATMMNNVRTRPTGTALRVAIVLAPWLGMIVLSLTTRAHLPFVVLVYPVVALAIWTAAPSFGVLSTLGYLTVVTAVLALAMAVVTPYGVAVSVGFSDKAFIGNGLLAGPFSHPNALGLVLLLGLPAVLLIPRTWLRLAGIAVILYALTWSAARTSLGSAVLILLLYPGLRRCSSAVGLMASRAVLLFGAFLVAVIPLTASTQAAYSGRGQIWLASLARWHDSRWFGAGPDAYANASRYDNDFGLLAFHGHNLLVNSLLVGGLFIASVIAVYAVAAARRALTLFRAGERVAVLVVVAFVYGSVLELVTDFRLPSGEGLIAWLGLNLVFFGRARVVATASTGMTAAPEARARDARATDHHTGALEQASV